MTSEASVLAVVDSFQRNRKAAWRQLVAAVRDGLEAALDNHPVDQPTVRFMSDEPELADEVSTRRRWLALSGGVPPDMGGVHATVLVRPPSPSAPALISAIKQAVATTRPGGVLILVTTVVDAPGVPTLSLSQVIECVQHATGGCVHLDELRSIRWSNERLQRGVLMTVTLLGGIREGGARE